MRGGEPKRSAETEAYRMGQQLGSGGVGVAGGVLSSLDASDGAEERRGEAAGWREASALHPKVLCELLHLQQVLGVDCGTGGGQRAQHVRLREGAEV